MEIVNCDYITREPINKFTPNLVWLFLEKVKTFGEVKEPDKFPRLRAPVMIFIGR